MRDIRKRRITIFVISAAALILAAAFYVMAPAGVSEIEILTTEGERIEESYDVYIGESIQLVCRIKPKTFAQRDVEYHTADEEILAVDDTGLITGIKEGETRLTVECAGVKKNLTVYVEPSVEGIKGLEKEITLSPGDEYQLKPKVVMAEKNLEVPKITYKSKRTTVATVDNNGKVTAVGEGTTRITVKAGTENVKVKVTVEEGTDSVAAAPTPDKDSTASQKNKTTAKKKTKKSKESTKKIKKKKKTSSDLNDNGSGSNSDDAGSDNSSSDNGNNDVSSDNSSSDIGNNDSDNSSTDTRDSSTDTGDNSADTGDSGSDNGSSDSGAGGVSDNTVTGTGNTGSDNSSGVGSDPNSQTDADLTTDN